MKYRLALCTAWELAKADGAISTDEINLHNRMAKFMQIQEKEIYEIRRLILLKSGLNLRDRIKIIQGDITEQSVDAIVNSANKTLLSGNKMGWFLLPGNNTKVDTAIHRVAGSTLQKACQSLNGCNVGEAKITQGYDLPASWIIHTVSPMWTDANSQELLAQCYRNSLMLSYQHSIRTVAFPALGTGTGKFPIEQAAKIAINEIQPFLNTHFTVEQVILVCYDESTYQKYLQAVEEIIGSHLELL